MSNVQSHFRMIGMADDGERILLQDLINEDAVWVSQTTDEEVQEAASQLHPGNRLKAELSGSKESAEWKIEAMEIVSDESLTFEAQAPPLQEEDAAWDRRTEEKDIGVLALFDDEEGTDLVCEIQAYPEYLDGEDMWEKMQTGLFDFQPWYNGLSGDDRGAYDLIVHNPPNTDYIALLNFPEGRREAAHDFADDIVAPLA